MGIVVVSSETALSHPPERVYDFVTAPSNWPLTYGGSAGIEDLPRLPLQPSDIWSEAVQVGDGAQGYRGRFTWRLLDARRPTTWMFRSLGPLGTNEDGQDGFEGITTITYHLTPLGADTTLFHRSLHCEVPRGVRIPNALLTVMSQPAGIDAYQDAVAREMDGSQATPPPFGGPR